MYSFPKRCFCSNSAPDLHVNMIAFSCSMPYYWKWFCSSFFNFLIILCLSSHCYNRYLKQVIYSLSESSPWTAAPWLSGPLTRKKKRGRSGGSCIPHGDQKQSMRQEGLGNKICILKWHPYPVTWFHYPDPTHIFFYNLPAISSTCDSIKGLSIG